MSHIWEHLQSFDDTFVGVVLKDSDNNFIDKPFNKTIKSLAFDFLKLCMLALAGFAYHKMVSHQ